MMATVPTTRNRNQRGATLVVALILLALMTVMGVFAARSAIFQEKSSANDFDRSLAMQAAECIVLVGSSNHGMPRGAVGSRGAGTDLR